METHRTPPAPQEALPIPAHVATEPHGTPAPRGSRRWPSLWQPIALLAFIALLIMGGSLHHVDGKPQPLAAVVNGLPVSMASYLRQLRFATNGYSGPRAAPNTPTARTVHRLLEDQAIQQAMAEVLIDYTAAQQRVQVNDAAVAQELSRITRSAGGPAGLQRQTRAAGMSPDDVRWVVRHNVLRNRLAQVMHDPAWLDKMIAKATIIYYVSDGAAPTDAVPAVSLGHPAPPFVSTDLNGAAVSLADLQGRPVVLNFWATWCGYCVQELPLLERFARTHPQIPVIAMDDREDPGRVRAYLKGRQLGHLRIWLDATGQAFGNYTLTGLPATFFIDRRGILRSYNFGPLADLSSLTNQARHAVQGKDNTYYNEGR